MPAAPPRGEGEPPWRSTPALVFGAVFVSYLFTDSSWDAAGNRGADLDTGLAHYAFDLGNIGFANALVCMGSFAAFGGWAVLTTRVFPRWVGWLMVGLPMTFHQVLCASGASYFQIRKCPALRGCCLRREMPGVFVVFDPSGARGER